MSAVLEFIRPLWPAPDCVQAASTLRDGGVSAAPWNTLNLAGHVGDEKAAVNENRRRLISTLKLPAIPNWLRQVHGTSVAVEQWSPGCIGDAAYTQSTEVVCAVLTADCLPLLMCDAAGTQVAAVHAGWRGLAAGVIEAALGRFSGGNGDILAWLRTDP